MLDLLTFYREEAAKHKAAAELYDRAARELIKPADIDDVFPPTETEETEAEYDEKLKEAQELNNECYEKHPDSFNPSILPKKPAISMDDLKKKTAEAAREYKVEILAKLSDLGVKRVSDLTEEQLGIFDAFLDSLGVSDA